MKKRFVTILAGLIVLLALGAPALAWGGAVDVDGKTYVFYGNYGNETTFLADGKTFIFGDNQVTIQEPGKPDRVLPLETATDVEPGVVEDKGGSGPQVASEVTIAENDVAFPSADDASESSYTAIATEGGAHTQNYDAYAQYGLSYDAAHNTLYYQNQRVRVFTDSYPIDEHSLCVVEHFDPEGAVDVEALRDLSARQFNPDGSEKPGGLLTGLRKLTGEEFARRDLTEWTAPRQRQNTAISQGEPMTPEEKTDLYAPYAALGIEYDAKRDQLRYQDKLIRSFLDVKSSNGEPFASGRFVGTMTKMNFDYGEIDVVILRDYADLDAQGYGRMTGVRATKAE